MIIVSWRHRVDTLRALLFSVPELKLVFFSVKTHLLHKSLIKVNKVAFIFWSVVHITGDARLVIY